MGTVTEFQAPSMVHVTGPKAPDVDLDRINHLDVEGLVRIIGHDARVATAVIRTRPSMAGEIMQHALSTSPVTAMILLAAIRYDILSVGGSSDETYLLLRSVMRVLGPGAAEIRAAMRAVFDELHARQAASDPLHRDFAEFDGFNRALAAADRDPEGAAFQANFHDRPAEAAAQLVREAKVDPKALRRHALGLTSMFQNSPEAGRLFVNAVIQQSGPDAAQVKRWVIAQLEQAVSPDIYKMKTGDADMVDGGPKARAQRLIPTLARLLAQPDVALDLVTIAKRVAHDVPDWMPSLRLMLRDVLDASWSKATRIEVRDAIHAGAAQMFEGSLTGPEHLRRSDSANAAFFIADVVSAEASIGVERSMVKAVGEMLSGIAKMLPAGRKVAAATGAVMSAAGKDGTPEWNADTLDGLLRTVFESVHPRPVDSDSTDQVRAYNAEYFDWAAAPQLEYARALGLERKR